MAADVQRTPMDIPLCFFVFAVLPWATVQACSDGLELPHLMTMGSSTKSPNYKISF